MALCSNANLNDEGFAAAIRDIERIDMMLSESVKNGQAESNNSLPITGNSEGNEGISMFNITGIQYPSGGPSDGDILVFSSAANAYVPSKYRAVEMTVCVNGVQKRIQFLAVTDFY